MTLTNERGCICWYWMIVPPTQLPPRPNYANNVNAHAICILCIWDSGLWRIAWYLNKTHNKNHVICLVPLLIEFHVLSAAKLNGTHWTLFGVGKDGKTPENVRKSAVGCAHLDTKFGKIRCTRPRARIYWLLLKNQWKVCTRARARVPINLNSTRSLRIRRADVFPFICNRQLSCSGKQINSRWTASRQTCNFIYSVSKNLEKFCKGPHVKGFNSCM